MKMKNIVKEFGDKFSVKKVGKILFFCLLILLVLAITGCIDNGKPECVNVKGTIYKSAGGEAHIVINMDDGSKKMIQITGGATQGTGEIKNVCIKKVKNIEIGGIVGGIKAKLKISACNSNGKSTGTVELQPGTYTIEQIWEMITGKKDPYIFLKRNSSEIYDNKTFVSPSSNDQGVIFYGNHSNITGIDTVNVIIWNGTLIINDSLNSKVVTLIANGNDTCQKTNFAYEGGAPTDPISFNCSSMNFNEFSPSLTDGICPDPNCCAELVPSLTSIGYILALLSLLGLGAITMRKMYKGDNNVWKKRN